MVLAYGVVVGAGGWLEVKFGINVVRDGMSLGVRLMQET
jgi:hypothetical protein